MWSVGDKKKKKKDAEEDSDDDESEEDSEEETSEEEDEESDDDGPAVAPVAVESREDRKAQKKARKEAAIAKQQAKTVEVGDLPSSDEDSDSESDSDEDDMPANPNHSKAARKQTTAPTDVEEVTEGVKNLATATRKEREAIEAAEAKERYMRQHLAGKTDEAKADMARLKLIREQREAEAARRAVCYPILSVR